MHAGCECVANLVSRHVCLLRSIVWSFACPIKQAHIGFPSFSFAESFRPKYPSMHTPRSEQLRRSGVSHALLLVLSARSPSSQGSRISTVPGYRIPRSFLVVLKTAEGYFSGASQASQMNVPSGAL